MEIVIIGILAVLLALSVYGNFNLLRQNEKLEDAYKSLDTYSQYFFTSIKAVHGAMVKIDESGVFQADDEVGYAFKTIKLLVDTLQSYNLDSDGETEEKE